MRPTARDHSTPDNVQDSRAAAHRAALVRQRCAPDAAKTARAALLSTVVTVAAVFTLSPAHAAEPAPATSAAKKPAATVKVAKTTTSTKTMAAPMNDTVVAEATPEQITAASYVYLGEYECDFKQVVEISASQRHPAYVDLRFGTSTYLMKPVVSPTGAIRLEDVRGETLLVQIARKSMLLNSRTGKRMVDECVSSTQRGLIEAARSTAVEVAMPSKGLTK